MAERVDNWLSQQPRSAYEAAVDWRNWGANVIVRLTRYKLDGTRCGMVQGRCAAWNWAYRVHPPGLPSGYFDMGRSLVEARKNGACFGATIVEDWPGGKTWKRGPKGGLTVGNALDSSDGFATNDENPAGVNRLGMKS
jgi:hypothetical protein